LNIFANTAPVLWEHGLPAIPLRGKGAFTPGWNNYCTEFPDDALREQWLALHPAHNIGLPLGPASGICMVDIDTEDEHLQRVIVDFLPSSPWVRIGKKGMAIAYRWTGIGNFKLASSESGMICELLGLGNQLVLPPSIHPDTGQPYVANADLWKVLDQLQELPRDIEPQLRRALSDAGVSLKGGGSSRTSSRVRSRAGGALHPRFNRWIMEQLKDAKKKLGEAVKNDRNNTLLRVASKLARHVAAADEDWSFYAAELTGVALEIGLEVHEIPGTLASAWRYGCDDPTAWIRLAQDWVYVSGADRFRHLASAETLTQQAFRTAFGSINPDPDVSITTFLTRNDYIEKVQNVAFDPPRPPGIYEENGLKWLNTYCPSAVVAVGGDATPFIEFVEYLVPDQWERDHLLKMLAHLVRCPGDKLNHALILGSKEHGVGKSTLLDILFELVGPHNCRKASSEELESQFNSYIESTLLVLVEEINLGAGGRKAYNKMKDLITGSTVPMRRLYQDARQVRNVANFVFLTNLERPILLEASDRRYFVVNSPAEPRDANYYLRFNDWWRANLGVIRHYLEQIDITEFNAKAPPPMTEAKAQLIKSSESPVVQELRDMLEERHPPFHVDVVTHQQVAEAIKRRLPGVSRNAVTDAMREIRAVSLGQHRLGKVPMGLRALASGDRPSLWAVRNGAFWAVATSQEIVQEYLAEQGRLAELPALPPEFSYAPASILPAAPESPSTDPDGWVLHLVRSMRERAQARAEEECVEAADC
jgi:hypothetical protein